MGGTVRSNTKGAINNYISRTQAFSKGTETKSPRVIRGMPATIGSSGFNKRDMSRTKVLDPIKISEEGTDNKA